MKYSAYDLSMAGDKYLGRSYDEMDCQAFVERCMRDVGYNRDLAGSNAWYRAMTWTGSPEECVKQFGQVPKGALIYILEQDGGEPSKYQGDGIGNASHIGIVTHRNDGAIHSSSSKGCVCTSKFQDKTIPNGGWNRIGLLNVFDYGNSVNWMLEHGGGSAPAGSGTTGDDGRETMQGKVYAENGKPVNLRKSPSKSAPLVDQIPVGTELEIIEYGDEWCKIVVSGLVGWMMTEFIQVEEDLPVADDSGIPPEDFGQGGESDPNDAVQLLATVYDQLRRICDEIEKAIGRG